MVLQGSSAIQELSAQQVDDVSGGMAVCNAFFGGYYGGLGGLAGSSIGPEGTILGATAGAMLGAWVGGRLCPP